MSKKALQQHTNLKHGVVPLGCNQGGLFTMSSLRSSLPSVSLSSMGASYIPTPSFGLGTRISMRTASSSSSGTSLGNLTSTGDVERFIQMKIQPDSDYLRMCNSTVDRIVHLLQNNIPEHLRPSEVVKAGSLGKGTALKGKSDIDLVMMLKNYSSVRSLQRDLPEILDDLVDSLRGVVNIRIEGTTPFCVQLLADVRPEEKLAIDLLPAVNVLETTGKDRVFSKMGNEDDDIQRYYSSSLTPLQVDLFKSLPTKLKSLIRLVKYWKKQNARSTWPTSYVMEVVTLASWRDAGSPQSFDMRKGFCAVMNSLTNHRNFSVVLHNDMCYAPSMLRRPSIRYIMDPCNPFNNVYLKPFQGEAWGWDSVAATAAEFLRKPLLRGVTCNKFDWH